MTPLLASAAGVTLIGGGAVTAEDLAQVLALAPALAAADSGADRALADGLMPQAVIGDLDSISTAGRAAIPPDWLHHVPEQETTDFQKCLTRIAAPFVVAVGFTGPRTDHLLACLTTLVQVPRPCLLLGGEDAIFAAPARLALDLPPGTRLSLYPLGPVTGTSRGLRWPIDGLTLDPARRIGTSNETTGPVALALTGPCLVILPREHAAAAIRAIAAA